MLPSMPDPNIPPNYRPAPRRNSSSQGKVIAVIAVVAILIAAAWSVYGMYRDRESGDEEKEYTWSVPVSGVSDLRFNVSLTIPGDELDLAKNSSIDRTGSSASVSDPGNGIYAVSDYVVVSDTIRTLAGKLWTEYQDKILNNALVDASYKTPKMFADYILTFVQVAVDYELDSEQFEENEYWLYPIETLYYGYGDCEDTSILAAAIYSALIEMDGPSAYVRDACVFLLPGHAMVGVDVIGGVPAESNMVILGTSEYYFGETTIDDIKKVWMGVGQITPDYMSASILGFTGHSTEYIK